MALYPGVLFVFSHWSKKKCGLPALHRNLVKDFYERKRRNGENIQIYSTVLEFKIKERTRQDAEKSGTTLIGPTREPSAADEPNIEWLYHHETYYKSLKELKNIQFVVGYNPKTAEAAINIHKGQFKDATLVLINHVSPEDPYYIPCGDRSKLLVKMLKMAAKADVVVSIGQGMKHQFQNFYRATMKGKNLLELVNVALLPKPNPCFFNAPMTLSVDGPFQIILLTSETLKNARTKGTYDTILMSIGKVANVQKVNGKVPKLKIWGQTSNDGCLEALQEKLKSEHVDPIIWSGSSQKELLMLLQQSHLCIIAPNHGDYPLTGLEALAIGLPTLVCDDTQFAECIAKCSLKYSRHCVVRDCTVESWSKSITGVLTDTKECFEEANKLKNGYQESEIVTRSYASFAALFQIIPECPTQEDIERSLTDLSELAAHVDLDGNLRQHFVNYVEEQRKIAKQKDWDVDMEETVKDLWNKLKEALGNGIITFLGREDSKETLQQICTNCFGDGTHVEGSKKKSLEISLRFPSLIALVRFQGSCEHGTFATELEPLLVSDECKKLTEITNIPVRLQVSYDKEKFQDVKNYFLERDGGGLSKVEWSDDDNDEELEFETEHAVIKSDEALCEKHRSLLCLEVSQQLEIHIATISAVFDAYKCKQHKGADTIFLQMLTRMNKKTRHILQYRQEPLALLGVRKFFTSAKDRKFLHFKDVLVKMFKNGKKIQTHVMKKLTQSLLLTGLTPLNKIPHHAHDLNRKSFMQHVIREHDSLNERRKQYEQKVDKRKSNEATIREQPVPCKIARKSGMKSLVPDTHDGVDKSLPSSTSITEGMTLNRNYAPTKEEDNYMRLVRMVFVEARKAMLRVFDSIHPPQHLVTILKKPRIKKIILMLIRKRKVTHHQLDAMYPKIGRTVTSDNFDIDLLIVLLGSICNLKYPPRSKDPSPYDHSIKSDIVRLRWYRNSIVRSTAASINDHDFATQYSELTNILERLNLAVTGTEIVSIEQG